MIIIDYREKELIETITFIIKTITIFNNITFTIQNLLIGDITLSDSTIIERKTLNDLSSSITDGRYEEQSYRLSNSEIHNHNIIYLIEGDLNSIHSKKLDKNKIFSAMFSLNHYKGFSVMRSLNITETAFIICNMQTKINTNKLNKLKFYDNLNDSIKITNYEKDENDKTIENVEKKYSSFVKKNKKENITINNINEIMLSQIPGISSNMAIIIMKEFKTIANLSKQVQENNDCIRNFTYPQENKIKKLNKTIVEGIIKYLN